MVAGMPQGATGLSDGSRDVPDVSCFPGGCPACDQRRRNTSGWHGHRRMHPRRKLDRVRPIRGKEAVRVRIRLFAARQSWMLSLEDRPVFPGLLAYYRSRKVRCQVGYVSSIRLEKVARPAVTSAGKLETPECSCQLPFARYSSDCVSVSSNNTRRARAV